MYDAVLLPVLFCLFCRGCERTFGLRTAPLAIDRQQLQTYAGGRQDVTAKLWFVISTVIFADFFTSHA